MRFTGNWRERFYALALMAGVEIISSYLLPFSPRNELYYMFCGAFNAVTLSILVTQFRYTPLAGDLLRLTVAQSAIQLTGLGLYLLPKLVRYVSPELIPVIREMLPVGIYNYGIHVIVTLTFLRILIVREGDESATRAYRRGLFGIRRNLRVWHVKGSK